jgi:hypothetical protein
VHERAIKDDHVKQLRDPQSPDSVWDDAAHKPTASTEVPGSEYYVKSSPFFLPLFTGVRGRSVSGTSCRGGSQKFTPHSLLVTDAVSFGRRRSCRVAL